MLTPLYDRIKEEIKNSGYIQADETSVQILKEKDRAPQKKSYMWMFKGGDNDYVMYHYSKYRNKLVPYKILQGCSGYLQTDAYQGYSYLVEQNKMTWGLCVAHARRKFHAITKISSKKEGLSHEVVRLMDKLYTIERKIKKKILSYIT